MLVRCLRPVLLRGKVHPPDSEIELDASAAQRLIEAGVVEPLKAKAAPAPKVKADDEDKPKAKPRKKAARKKATTKKD